MQKESERVADVRLQMDVKKKKTLALHLKFPNSSIAVSILLVLIIIFINVMQTVRANYSLGRVPFGQFASQERW